MRDSINLRGALHIELRNKEGDLVSDIKVPNTITDLGKAYIADRLGSQTQTAMSNMAIGTGTPSTTTLGTELARRNFRTPTSSSATWTYVAEWNIDDNVSGTITEAGIFNSDLANSGTMLCSSSFTGIVKAVNDTLTITWTITIS